MSRMRNRVIADFESFVIYLTAATEKSRFSPTFYLHFMTTVETATYEFSPLQDRLDPNREMRI
jgi:hypothetical protein